jgi:hypothetical protein
MHTRTGFSCFFLCLAIIILILCTGCTGQVVPAQTVPVPVVATTSSPTETTQVIQSLQPDDLSQATRIEVTTVMAHWSEGPVNDGITVHPALFDASGRKLQWSGVTLPVDIEIYTIDFDMKQKPVRGQKVYGGSGTISNWTDGDAFMGGGIRVPFFKMDVPAGAGTYGWTYATVHLPDGRTVTGQFNATTLKPPVPQY